MSIEGAFYALELATTAAEVQEVLDFIDQELNWSHPTTEYYTIAPHQGCFFMDSVRSWFGSDGRFLVPLY